MPRTNCITKYPIGVWRFSFVQEQRVRIENSLKCVLIEPAGHSPHCNGNVWLLVLHRNPPLLCSGGTILQCHVCNGLGGREQGQQGYWHLRLTASSERADMLWYHEWVLGNIWAKHLTLMRTFILCPRCLGTSFTQYCCFCHLSNVTRSKDSYSCHAVTQFKAWLHLASRVQRPFISQRFWT